MIAFCAFLRTTRQAHHQAWSGDITYIQIGQKHRYLLLLMDIYSRRLLGYIASDSILKTRQ